MHFQRVWSSEGFPTRFTFMISLSLIVCLDMSLQIWDCSQKFSTNFATLMILLVIIFNMSSQFPLWSKRFIAHIANEFFILSMNSSDMLVLISFTWKTFLTYSTFKILFNIFLHFNEDWALWVYDFFNCLSKLQSEW